MATSGPRLTVAGLRRSGAWVDTGKPAGPLQAPHERGRKGSMEKTLTKDSALMPGVKFTVRRMGYGRRIDVEMETVKIRQRLREIEAERPPLTPEEEDLINQLRIAQRKVAAVTPDQVAAVIAFDVEPITRKLRELTRPEDRQKRASLDEEWRCVEQTAHPAWLRSGFVSIEGGGFDNWTVEEFLLDAPPELTSEIYTAITEQSLLTENESKNLLSPGTSGTPVAGQTSDSTVPTASGGNSGESETASSSIPSA